MKTIHFFTQLLIIFVIIGVNTGSAQLSAYHGIVFPYDQQTLAGKALGGASVAVPDYVPDALGNPAGIAFTETVQIFTGINTDMDRYKLDYYQFPGFGDEQKSKITFSRNQFLPAQFTVGVPFSLFNKKAAAAVSVNRINSPEIETMDIPEIKRDLDYDYNFSGNVWNSSLAAGIRLNKNLSIGLSWTQWYGKWDWRTERSILQDSINSNISAPGTFDYVGSSFSLGVLQQFSKLSVGLVVHSPFTLMKADKIKLDLWRQSYPVDLEQQFNGAVSAGLAYQVTTRSRIGLGYRFQEKFTVKETLVWENGEPFNYDYSNAHKVSIAGEYAFGIFSLRVPVFLAYYGQWLPVTEKFNWSGQSLLITEKNRFQNGAALGLKLDFKNLDFFFVTSWNGYSFYAEQTTDPPAT